MRNVVAIGTFILVMGWRCAAVRADGGAVRLVEQQHGCQVSVFTSPHPLRAGAVDFSVLLQDAASGAPVSDATITVRLAPRDRPAPVVVVTATTEAATNKLFRAAMAELDEPGWWEVEVCCETVRGPIEVRFALEASAAMPRLPTLLPWVGWPFVLVLLFGAHRALVWRATGTTAIGKRRGEVD